jgi:hypothetical protein
MANYSHSFFDQSTPPTYTKSKVRLQKGFVKSFLFWLKKLCWKYEKVRGSLPFRSCLRVKVPFLLEYIWASRRPRETYLINLESRCQGLYAAFKMAPKIAQSKIYMMFYRTIWGPILSHIWVPKCVKNSISALNCAISEPRIYKNHVKQSTAFLKTE